MEHFVCTRHFTQLFITKHHRFTRQLLLVSPLSEKENKVERR